MNDLMNRAWREYADALALMRDGTMEFPFGEGFANDSGPFRAPGDEAVPAIDMPCPAEAGRPAPEKKRKTFRRGPVSTLIGFSHAVIGCTATLWAVARILIIGPESVFEYGTSIGVYNYIWESRPLFLWLSGIGILRAGRWGRILAMFWAVLTILTSGITMAIRRHYWGDLALGPGWSERFLTAYATVILVFYILYPYRGEIYGSLKEGLFSLGRLPGLLAGRIMARMKAGGAI